MQTLVETLNLWNNAYDALCEAQKLVEQLETETNRILNHNTEPIRVATGNGGGRMFTTPADLERLPLGTVISVGGSEYMRIGYSSSPWTDCLGCRHSHYKMFRRALEDADECEIIHKGN
nr:MAG TPA: N-terminal domain of NWD NACHT-NTPase [Caudoviricetes sp.]